MKRFVRLQPNTTLTANFIIGIYSTVSHRSSWKIARRVVMLLWLVLFLPSWVLAQITTNITAIVGFGSRICPVATGTVNFTVDTGAVALPAGTYTYRAELSDQTGNWPGTSIGTVNSSIGGTGVPLNPLSINVTLPASLAHSDQFMIRVTVDAQPETANPSSALDARRDLLAPTPGSFKFCAGENMDVTVDVGECDFNAGNNFTLQISDPEGDFSGPNLSAGFPKTTNAVAGVGDGTYTFTLPSDLPVGTGYRIRVTASDPAGVPVSPINLPMGASGNISILAAPFRTNPPSGISTDPPEMGILCQGADYELFFPLPDMMYNAGNDFIAQIGTVDGSGNFSLVKVIGSFRNFTVLSGGDATIRVVIPYDLPASGPYYIRYVTTNPVTESCFRGPYTVPQIRPFTDPTNHLVCGTSANFNIAAPMGSGTNWQSICFTSPGSPNGYMNMVTSGLATLAVNDIARSGNRVYAAMSDGISRADNWAVNPTFNLPAALSGNLIRSIFVSGTNVYAASATNGLFISSDGLTGAAFTNVTTASPYFLMSNSLNKVVVAQDGTVYVASVNGLERSGGMDGNYTDIITGTPVNDVFLDGNYVYAATANGVMVSPNRGDNFITYNLPTTIGLPSNAVQSIFVRDNIIYVGTDIGFAYSVNGGLNFTTVTAGLTSKSVNRIFVDANGRIYGATQNGLVMANESLTAFTGVIAGLFNTFVTGINLSGDELLLATLQGVARATITTSSSTNLVLYTDANSLCRYQAVVSLDGCSVTSNMVRIPDIPQMIMEQASVTVSNGSSTGKTVTVASTAGLAVGMPVSVTAGTGTFAENTIISAVLNTTQFTVNVVPTNALSGATIGVLTTHGPQVCGGNTGRITVKGLIPQTKYQLNFTGPAIGSIKNGDTITVDGNGQFSVNFLTAGAYTVSVTSLVLLPGQSTPACSSNQVSVSLSDPVKPLDPVPPVSVAPVCEGSNITISLQAPSNTASEEYRWYNNAGAVPPALFDSTPKDQTFTPPSAPAASGSYWVVRRNNFTQCSSDTIQIDYTVSPRPIITCTPNSADMSIVIALTNAGPGTYTLTYNDAANNLVTVSGLTAASFPRTIGPGLPVGNYSNIQITQANGGLMCTSNIIGSCPLFGEPDPESVAANPLQTTVCNIPGVAGGFFQDVIMPSNVADDYVAGMEIAVGRIRQTKAVNPTAANLLEKVEMRGWISFNLDGYIPLHARIDRVQFLPKSIAGAFRSVGDVPVIGQPATGDIQFDLTQISQTNYPLPVGYQQKAFDDLKDDKYNDFTISNNVTGALTDLGTQGVTDLQNRLRQATAANRYFQLGIALSGSDFDVPVLQFHGIVFDEASEQNLCITYHLEDFGDLPEPKYATDLAGGLIGPSHRIDSIDIDTRPDFTELRPALYIGATPPDAEIDGQSDINAAGDDTNGDDENLDPATALAAPLIAGTSSTITVPVTNYLTRAAAVTVFFDWNNDGVFNNTDERFSVPVSSATIPNPAGPVTAFINNALSVPLVVPTYVKTATVGVRVRITSAGVVDAYGPAPDGEVEDFLVEVRGLDFGDLPDAVNGIATNDFRTRFEDDGARHGIVLAAPIYMGATVDSESDGQVSANADGDDTNPVPSVDDEDGVVFVTSPLIPGLPATVTVTARNGHLTNSATLFLYADFNNDGISSLLPVPFTSGDPVFSAGISATRTYTFLMPLNAAYIGNRAFFRFRFTTQALANDATGAYGLAADGEVEDYISGDIALFDWGDLPEPKYITDKTGGVVGANHRIAAIPDPSMPTTYIPALYIGNTNPDIEADGIPSANAIGDDNTSPSDDEDLSFANFVNKSTGNPTLIIAGEPITFRISVVNNYPATPATLWAFIDWNGDGSFTGQEETRQLTVPANTSTSFDFDYLVPPISKPDSIGIRVRLTSGSILDAYGVAPDGEVEDFIVEFMSRDFGDLPDVTAAVGKDDFQTLKANDGARHAVPFVPLVYLGEKIDTESDGQPSGNGNGDDSIPSQNDDEDGIVFLTPMVPGKIAQFAFYAVNNAVHSAYLNVWADWNNDGTLELVSVVNSADLILASLGAIPTTNKRIISFKVPANATLEGGKVHFRFRITTFLGMPVAPSANGMLPDGEVEDYVVPLFKIGNLVWEDRNHNGFQDAEEINLGIQNVRLVMRFGGVDPVSGVFDSVTQHTISNLNTLVRDTRPGDLITDYVTETYTNAKGLYGFTGMIEGFYQIIAADTFGLTPTRFDWIKNVTEEDRDSDAKPLKNPWEYATGERRQSKSQEWKLTAATIGTDEEGNLDQDNPQLPDPNQVDDPLPDNRVEQRIDFGYTGFDFGDLAQVGSNPSVLDFNTEEDGINGRREGPKHIVSPDLRLGHCQDVEWEGQSDLDAGAEFKPAADMNGDDPIADFSNYPNFPYAPSQGRRWPFHQGGSNDCGDDEDGIRFNTPLIAGYDAQIAVRYLAKLNLNGPDAYLHAWFDWNGDGNFYDPAGNIDPDEHIIFTALDGGAISLEPTTKAVNLEMSYLSSPDDSVRLTFRVPDNIAYNNGNILARFRISFDPRIGPDGILAPNLNFPDPQPGAASSTVPGGIVPFGEVEDYFIALSKVGNLVWEDRDYDGLQDALEPSIANVPIRLEFAGVDGIFGSGDPYEYVYFDTTDASGKYDFCGLIGNVDPSGIPNPTYRLLVSDPAGMTATFNNPDPSDDNCIDDNSNGDDKLIDDRITLDTFTISNPMMLCVDENGKSDIGGLVAGSNLPPSPDALNRFPDNQYDESRDFAYVGFDYGDLPGTALKAGSAYPTLRDSMDGAFGNKFGARHAMQPRLFLGSGVDAEPNGQPDDDAGSNAVGSQIGDDDNLGVFVKGTNGDDENGILLLSPLLPGERAFIKVNYTAQDTVNGSYVNRVAFLDAFVDWNGNGIFDLPGEKLRFTHQVLSSITFNTNNVPSIPFGPVYTATLPATGTTGSDSTILAFDVPNDAVFDSGMVYMRFRLGWTNYGDSYPNSFPVYGLGPDNNAFHMNVPPFVKSAPPFTDAANNTGRYPYPLGEVEDYGIPVAKISNLAWYDHDVFGDQDGGEDFVDSLHLVLIWGGINASTGLPDTVGYQSPSAPLHASQGIVTDLMYNRTVLPPQVFTANGSGNTAGYPLGGVKLTGTSPAADSGRYSFRGLIPGFYYVIPEKYLKQDSASFVAFWPRHRVMTLQDNPGVSDLEDSDGIVNTDAAGQTSRGPGAFLRINDANGKTPEVSVNDRPLNENSTLVDGSDANPNTPVFFPDEQWDKTIDFGWIDEPNIEANLDVVGVNFPTSQNCNNFNVIMHLCVKNPTEVPLDSFMMALNLKQAYGDAFIGNVTLSIVDSAFTVFSGNDKVRKSFPGAVAALKPFLNTAYNGDSNVQLFNSTGSGGQTWNDTTGAGSFYLPGDGMLCVRIEFEIDWQKNATFLANTPDGWYSRALVYARAVGLRKDNNQKRPVRDFRFFDPLSPGQSNPRFGLPIQVRDWSDEFDDPMFMNGLTYPASGDSILFEGFVTDRGINGDYQTFHPYSRLQMVSTARDKYADEDDFTIQNDLCWINTRWNGGVNNVNISMDISCNTIINADVLLPNFLPACGFDKYPEGSYYRVIIQDEHTGETVWASVDRVPFNAKQYLNRKLIYKVRSVANSCNLIWGQLTLEDKTKPIVICPINNADRTVNSSNTGFVPGARLFICTDVDSIFNIEKSWTDTNYAYYSGIATSNDSCGTVYLDRVSDKLEIVTGCTISASGSIVTARILRSFFFRDEYGNEEYCTQTIIFVRPQIILPECQVEVPTHLAKNDSLLLPKDLISVYGLTESVPYVINASGKKIYITDKDFCGFAVSYEDKFEFPAGSCGRKVVRIWKIMDWCNSAAAGYPKFLETNTIHGDNACYPSPLTWTTREFVWEQKILVSDNTAPIVFIPNLDKDSKQQTTGYKPSGPFFLEDPNAETTTYDPGDIFEFSTGPIDCSSAFSFSKSMIEVIEQNSWCFDLEVYVRRPILDFDERPTGRFSLLQDGAVKVSGSCLSGYNISGVQMPKVPDVSWFLKIRVFDVCNSETIIWVPFRIVDKIAPVMKCIDNLNISFDNVGVGSLSVDQVDAGSVDACSKLSWRKLRRVVSSGDCRMQWLAVKDFVDVNKNGQVDKDDYIDEDRNKSKDPLEGFSISAESGLLMSPYLNSIPIYCCDGDSVMVELWGEDKAGNRNFCWNWIRLEDKTSMDFLLPFNQTYTCTQQRPLIHLLSKGGTYSEGTPEYSASVALFKEDVLLLRGQLCSTVKKEIVVMPLMQCNGPSTISISWRLIKQSSKGAVTYTTPVRTLTILPVNEYNIMFPADVMGNCTNLRDTANVIDGGELGCDILAVLVQDKRYNGATKDGAPVAECYKIFRTFTVINWCQYTESCVEPMNWAVVVPRDIAGRPGTGSFNGVNVLVRDPNAIDPNAQPKYYFEDASGTVQYPGARDATKERGNAGDKVAQAAEEVTSFTFNGSDPRGNPNCPVSNGLFAWMFTQYLFIHDDFAPEALNDRAPIGGWAGYQNKETCGGEIAIEFSTQDMCSATEIQQDGGSVSLERVYYNENGDKAKRVGVSATSLNPLPPLLEGDNKTLSPKQVWRYTSKVLPPGRHSLTVVVRDDCGNVSKELDIPFIILDTSGTAPICINGLSTKLIFNPQSGNREVVVLASDFKALSETYDCSGLGAKGTGGNANKQQITNANYFVYMDIDGNGKFDAADGIDGTTGRPLSSPYQTSIKITCAQLQQLGSNLPSAARTVIVRLYTKDNASQYAGNVDNWAWCETFLSIENAQECTGGTNASAWIGGEIRTSAKVKVAGVEVNLSGQTAIMHTTNVQGQYSFADLAQGYDYTITPKYDQNPLNGLTTMDLVMMTKHVLGQVPLTSPYEYIAADINNSKTITTLDMVQLRRMILGIDGKFQSNTSWRFVDASYKFPDPLNPWKAVFPEVLSVNNLSQGMAADFVAVKIGDINGSALGVGMVRTGGTFLLHAENQVVKGGTEVRIPVSAALAGMEGYQFTLGFERRLVDLLDIEYGKMQQEHIGIFANEGLITASWNGESPGDERDILFTLLLRVKADAKDLREVLHINNRITAAEAYTKTGEYASVALKIDESGRYDNQPMLYQNIPNPFTGETIIGFHLVEGGESVLKVSDIQGRVLRVIRHDYSPGHHQVRFQSGDLPPGILQYTLTCGAFTATRRMLLTK